MADNEVKREGSPDRKKARGKARIELGEVTERNVGQLKLLNSTVFPVKYQPVFYKDVLVHPELSRLAYFNSDILAGAVCCREVVEEGVNKLYIMTLGVLATYRQMGLGTVMLEYVLKLCKERPHLKQVYLHVQVNNDVAIEFYKKFGFLVGKLIKDYYKRIEPADCYLVYKEL